MRFTKQVALVVSLLFLIVVSVFADNPQVTIAANGRFFNTSIGSSSANIRLVVKVEKHEGNRLLGLSCDGEIYVSSVQALEGEKEKRIFDFAFNLPRGQYVCGVILTRIENGKTKNFPANTEVVVH